MKTEDKIKKLVDFARSIGMPVSVSRKPSVSGDTLWDGHVLHVHLDSDDFAIAHEIAHWVLAKKSRRSRELFGLSAEDDVSDKFRFAREDEASLLQKVILTELGCEDRTVESVRFRTSPTISDALSNLTHRHVLPLSLHKRAGRYRRKP